jgi:hypothetical protein
MFARMTSTQIRKPDRSINLTSVKTHKTVIHPRIRTIKIFIQIQILTMCLFAIAIITACQSIQYILITTFLLLTLQSLLTVKLDLYYGWRHRFYFGFDQL